MYKKQLKFQKIVCMLCLIAMAVAFVYSLGMMTDLYDALYFTMRNPDKPDNTRVPGSRIFYDMQPFNKQFVEVNILLILVACVLFLSNTHMRRKYYIGNYIAIGAYSVAAVGSAVWYHDYIAFYTERFRTTVDFTALKEYSEMMGTRYLGPEDTFLLDLHYGVAALAIVSVVLLIANMIWKILLMREEKKLIQAGEEAAV